MGGASRVLLVGLRIWQLICSVIVLGILSSFLHRVHNAGARRDGRIVYGVVTASISTFFSIVFIAPFLYAFLAFPFDCVMWIMWLVLFCLEMTRTGTHTCSARWFWNYWGYIWGGWWRRPFVVVNGPADIGYSGCSQWRTVLAFSFMAMFAYLISTILGAYVVSKYWSEKKRNRRAGTHPQTTKIGGPMHMEGAGPGQTAGVAGTGPGAAHATVPGTAPGVDQTMAGQPGTYASTGQSGTYSTTAQPGTYSTAAQPGTYGTTAQPGTYNTTGQSGTYV